MRTCNRAGLPKRPPICAGASSAPVRWNRRWSRTRSNGTRGSDPRAQGRLGFGSYDLVVDVLAGMLKDRDYVCGDRFTAADIYVGAQVDWGLSFGTLPVRDEFTAYAERLRAREAYKAAKAIDAAHIAAMQKRG